MTDNNDFLAIYGHRANLLNNNVAYLRVLKMAKWRNCGIIFLLHCRTWQKYGRKAEQQNGGTKRPRLSGIINPLFDGLTYNTSYAVWGKLPQKILKTGGSEMLFTVFSTKYLVKKSIVIKYF